MFDAVVLLPSVEGAELLAGEAVAIDWLRDAFGHLKVIGHNENAGPVFEKAAVDQDADDGVVAFAKPQRHRGVRQGCQIASDLGAGENAENAR